MSVTEGTPLGPTRLDTLGATATGDYSYFRFNPGLSKYFNSDSLNGGGQVTFFITPNIGLTGDLQGYGSYTE